MPAKSKWKIPPIDNSLTQSNRIKPSSVLGGKVSFNFCRLCEKCGKFEYNNHEVGYFKKLIERIKEVSDLTRQQISTSHKRVLRAHPIDFSDPKVTENTFGFGTEIDDDAWQLFQISTNKYGRVHGYFVGDTFYVVWLDPNHDLYA